jgi:hypothetical protein|tara:strand:- start:271 stop:450 length:180 start_codon:yes stop_codon:yes gene_type:complete
MLGVVFVLRVYGQVRSASRHGQIGVSFVRLYGGGVYSLLGLSITNLNKYRESGYGKVLF